MNILYNAYNQAEVPVFYLAGPDGQIICPLNGIQSESAELTLNFNDTSELSFTCSQYIDVYGVRVPSGGYDMLDEFMRIYVENVGWFIMSAPQICHNGTSETKQVFARSVDMELTDKDLVGFRVNCGTSDSIEMLVPDNVEYIDDVAFARQQVHFYDPDNPNLSLLHMILDFAQVEGWSIGYVDEIPKVYRSYQNGVLTESTVQLKDEIGTFDIDSQNVYSFLTQDVEQFFECIIIFDIRNRTINAYRPEHIGKDTNVTIGFRNLQNSHNISVDKDSIYTRCRVSGDDNPGIESVNFGSNVIEDLSYFLNTKYMSEALISKYQTWRSDMESKRYEYIDYTRTYNQQLNVLSELMNRVPLDDCMTEWNKFSVENLLEAKDNYLAQKEGYEAFYIDADGNFDEAALASSVDADTYYQIRDVILPSIDIELFNRELTDSTEKKPYIETYKTNWRLYGIDELLVQLDIYQTQKETLEKTHYDLAFEDYQTLSSTDASSYPAHTRDMHEEMHAQYQDIIIQLDDTIAGSCASAYQERKTEYESAEALADEALSQMQALAQSVEKSNWRMDGEEPFTKAELRTLSRLYRDTDYTNNNMFLTSSDDQVTAIDEQLKLYDAACADLSATSQPQYTYQTDLDNFLALYDYREYADNLEPGDFLYLGLQDDYLVKLRLISCSYNPLVMDNNLNITFSNMIRTGSQRYDTTYLLGLSGNTSKNSIRGTSNSFSQNEGTTVTAGLIKKLLSSSLFNGAIGNTVSSYFNAMKGQLVVADNLETELIETIDMNAENGFFQYLQSCLIATDQIVSDSASMRQLSALTANIKEAVMGAASAETGIILKLSSQNAVIEEAFLKQVISDYISVNDLKAESINTDQIQIASEDGSLSIIGGLLSFKDPNGNVRIQIGKDTSGNFTFIVYDEIGEGILIDQDGIHESAISDGLIQNSMIADNAVESHNISWGTCGAQTDENGNPVWNAAQIIINDEGLDVQFASVQNTINGMKTTISEIKQNASEITQNVTDLEGNISTLSTSLDNVTIQVEDSKGQIANLQTSADGITSEVSSLKGDITSLQQTSEQIESTVVQKADSPLSCVRYIRDWLSGGTITMKTEITPITRNCWVECKVMSGDNNIAASIVPELYNYSHTHLGTIYDLSVYTDDALIPTDQSFVPPEELDPPEEFEITDDSTVPDESGTSDDSIDSEASTNEESVPDEIIPYITTSNSSSQYLLLDLGDIYNLDSITVWHYYIDNRACNHKLEISLDGINWRTLYDSEVSGCYKESKNGRTYYLSDSVNEYQYSNVKQSLNSITTTLSTVGNSLNNLQNNIDGKYAELKAELDAITSKVATVEDGVLKNSSTITQTSKTWTALFQTLGMIEGGQTNITLSSDGIEVSNPSTNSKTLITIDEFAGYFEGEEIFSINEDMTRTRRIFVERGVDTNSIKLVPVTYTLEDGTSFKALVHVKSGGTS